MKVVIAGPRDMYVTQAEIARAILASGFDVTGIITGDARGIDSVAKEYAEAWGIPLQVFEADWYTFGRAAGPIRNEQMAIHSEGGGAIVFKYPDKWTKGSKNMRGMALEYDLSLYVHVPTLWEQVTPKKYTGIENTVVENDG